MNPDQTITLNHNAAECIKSVSNFGFTTYHNICNGTSVNVPWGMVDMVLGSMLCASLLLLLFLMLRAAWVMTH